MKQASILLVLEVMLIKILSKKWLRKERELMLFLLILQQIMWIQALSRHFKSQLLQQLKILRSLQTSIMITRSLELQSMKPFTPTNSSSWLHWSTNQIWKKILKWPSNCLTLSNKSHWPSKSLYSTQLKSSQISCLAYVHQERLIT